MLLSVLELIFTSGMDLTPAAACGRSLLDGSDKAPSDESGEVSQCLQAFLRCERREQGIGSTTAQAKSRPFFSSASISR